MPVSVSSVLRSLRRTGRCLKGLIAILAAFSAIPAFAVVQLDGTSTQVARQGATTLSWTHPLRNGANRMIVCGVTFGYNDAAKTKAPTPMMTSNGVAMTSAIEAPTTAQLSRRRASFWRSQNLGLGRSPESA